MKEETLINKTVDLIHKILDHFEKMENDNVKSFREEIKTRFCFANEFDWNILLNAIYTFQDTELAKSSFSRFHLQGPSRHPDIGERYLRLYGVLSAVYIQHLAMINLVEIFKITNKQAIIENLKDSKIIQLRNKAASHSSNFFSHSDNKAEHKFHVYEISRPALESNSIRLLKNQELFEDYNLMKDLDDFDKTITNLLFEICQKMVKSVFNNQGKFNDELKLLYEEISGNVVNRLPGGDALIVKFN